MLTENAYKIVFFFDRPIVKVPQKKRLKCKPQKGGSHMKYDDRNVVDELDFEGEDIDRVQENTAIANAYAGLSAVGAANQSSSSWTLAIA